MSVERLTPTELIKAVLRAPVDLLWNGGIGTYVKASTESHSQVGDRTNDAVRIDASALRCRMVGEGGNLGFTQLGRIDYAIGGGLIYTDAIDNSAGVDTSDHEVNIKILLGDVIAAGEMTLKQRNNLLDEMTDEVAELVLENNRAQTLALMIARQQSLPMVNVHARYLDALEREGWLDRGLEFLPSDKQIAERQSTGSGLTTPEFAVLIAYTKNANVAEILTSDLPEDPAWWRTSATTSRCPCASDSAAILEPPAAPRDPATHLVNQMANLSGISYDHRMTGTRGSITDVSRAWAPSARCSTSPCGGTRSATSPTSPSRTSSSCTSTAGARPSVLAVDPAPSPPPGRHRARGRALPRAGAGTDDRPRRLPARCVARGVDAMTARRIAQGVPERLAARSAVWRLLHTTFDVIELAERVGSRRRMRAPATGACSTGSN